MIEVFGDSKGNQYARLEIVFFEVDENVPPGMVKHSRAIMAQRIINALRPMEDSIDRDLLRVAEKAYTDAKIEEMSGLSPL